MAKRPTRISLTRVRDDAKDCRACDLWKHATQTVFGEGPRQAALMLIGEQPGDAEDLAGQPFVGPAFQGHRAPRRVRAVGACPACPGDGPSFVDLACAGRSVEAGGNEAVYERFAHGSGRAII